MSLHVLARNTIFTTFATAFRLIVSFFITPFMILHLGKESYGVLTLIVTFSLSGALSFFSLGFQGALVKYVAEYFTLNKFRELNQVISATIFIYSVMALFASLILFLLSMVGLPNLFSIPTEQANVSTILLYLAAVQILFELPGFAIDAILTGLQRFDILALLEIGRSAISTILIYIALLTGHGILTVGSIFFITAIFHTLGMVLLTKRICPVWKMVTTFDKNTLWEIIDFTKDLFIIRINALIYNNMDKIIIGSLLSSTLLTDYDIANRIHSFALIIMGLAPSVVMPAASALNATNDTERLRSLLLKGSKYTLAMSLPVTLALIILADPIIQHWISPQYKEDAVLAQLFLLYMLFWPILQVGTNMLIGVREIKPFIRIQIVSVGVNLLLSIGLISSLGVKAVIIGTIIGNIIVFIPYVTIMLKRFDIKWREFLQSSVLNVYWLAIPSTGILYVITRLHAPQSLFEVAGYAFFSIIIYYTLFVVAGLSAAEIF